MAENKHGFKEKPTLQQSPPYTGDVERMPYKPAASFTEPTPGEPELTELQRVARTGEFVIVPSNWSDEGKATGVDEKLMVRAEASVQRNGVGIAEFGKLVRLEYKLLKESAE